MKSLACYMHCIGRVQYLEGVLLLLLLRCRHALSLDRRRVVVVGGPVSSEDIF